MTSRGVKTGWQAINKIEAGTRNVTIAEAAAIAGAFGVTVNGLIGQHAKPKADRDFVLQRLHESVVDAQRAVRTSVRDITATLGGLTEFERTEPLDAVVANVEAATSQLDSAATELAQAGGKIAQARGGGQRILRGR